MSPRDHWRPPADMTMGVQPHTHGAHQSSVPLTAQPLVRHRFRALSLTHHHLDTDPPLGGVGLSSTTVTPRSRDDQKEAA